MKFARTPRKTVSIESVIHRVRREKIADSLLMRVSQANAAYSEIVTPASSLTSFRATRHNHLIKNSAGFSWHEIKKVEN